LGKVSLVRTDAGTENAVRQAVSLIGGLDAFIRRGDRVLLKPNLNGETGFTDLGVIEALLKMLRDYGAGRTCIAESTFGDAGMTELFFDRTGIRAVANRHGVDLINLNASEAVEVKVDHPLKVASFRIAKEALETDAILNVPNMKVHYATGITLALKNMKGVLVGDEKRRMHEIGLDDAIVDLNNTIRPRLTVVDAIRCMERMGPRGGDLVDLNLVLAGGSSAEVDCIGASIMGIDPRSVRHLQKFIQCNSINPDRIETSGENVEKVRRPFRQASMERIVPDAFTVHDHRACSACMNAFLLSCQMLKGKSPEPYDIEIGGRSEGDCRNGVKRIGFGNCSLENGSYDLPIKGCPPYPYELRGVIDG
jgi:uncharacterized protein (DUF362 family)